MILFLYTFTINRTKALSIFYQELAKKIDSDNLKIVDISREDIDNINNHIKEAELIVFDTSIVLSMSKLPLLERNLYIKNTISKNFYYDVWNLIDRSDKPVFFMHPSSDLQAVNFGLDREFYLSLLKRISGIFWPYHQCPVDRNNDKERYEFKILEPYQLTKAGLINIWDEIKANVPISIDFARCVSEKEMNKKSKRKFWDVIVPGMTYITRNIAQGKMLDSGLRLAPYVSSSRWLVLAPYMLANKAIPQKYSTLFYQKQSYNLYRFMISHSAVSFACGSELRYFVRKFLEIPAFRSAMVAYPSLNMLDYGFKDGVHYLHAYPEEAGEKALYLIKNKSIADKLVQNAWELVAKQHTASERVNQVLDCLHFFKQGKLKSAGYFNGKFEIN